ncbi:MAG: RagB/SusD family nutrient uptake outer membrane protein [Crocinitomicaceae bacterium]|nr:RagB/SusD family nutrient uptake outer membrane protein [Crocinitomicaceae bacterium]
MKKTSCLIIFLFGFFSCQKSLDLSPRYGFNAEVVYSEPNNYIKVLAKLYSGLSMTGIQGPAGQPDISQETIDEGFSAYVRVLWNLQELPTDEAVCGWNDPGIPTLNKMQWNAEDGWVKGMYYRIYYQITLCNEYIFQSRDEKLSQRGFSDLDIQTIQTYRNEARFLRALSYYHALDLFGSVPFVDENDRVGAFEPPQISRENLFLYVESELLDIENELLDANSAPYGRATKQAVQTLLAKMYLNAEVYIGSERYSDCINFCNEVISSNNFQLDDNYQDIFLADNNLSPEIIFPVVYDGLYAQTWGGTTFMVCASIGGDMNASEYGVNGGWGGLRATPEFVNNFDLVEKYWVEDITNPLNPDTSLLTNLPTDPNFIVFDTIQTTDDGRFLFFQEGQQLEITSLGNFRHGYAFPKYKNINSDGSIASNNGFSAHVDIDFPMFRLADVYLMYAESSLRKGDQATALQYVNALRQRAYGNSNYDYTNITLEDILDERSCELSWEGTRRTDLIRYGYFTSSSYLWSYKGGEINGTAVGDYLNLFPIPTADIVLNSNLIQNNGY